MHRLWLLILPFPFIAFEGLCNGRVLAAENCTVGGIEKARNFQDSLRNCLIALKCDRFRDEVFLRDESIINFFGGKSIIWSANTTTTYKLGAVHSERGKNKKYAIVSFETDPMRGSFFISFTGFPEGRDITFNKATVIAHLGQPSKITPQHKIKIAGPTSKAANIHEFEYPEEIQYKMDKDDVKRRIIVRFTPNSTVASFDCVVTNSRYIK